MSLTPLATKYSTVMEPPQAPNHTTTGDEAVESFSLNVNSLPAEAVKNLSFEDAKKMLKERVEKGHCPPQLLIKANKIRPMGLNGAEEARQTLVKVLEVTLIASRFDVQICAAHAIVDRTNPVDVYFSLLSTPEEHERRYMNNEVVTVGEGYSFALKVFMIFISKQDQELMEARCEQDPILELLCDFIDNLRSVLRTGDTALIKTHLGFDGMYSGLLKLVWRAGIPQGHAVLGQYKRRTRRVLEYFGWVILGRKDITCMVPKPWASWYTKTSRNTPNEDLGRLPAIHTAHDRETEEFSRLSRLSRLFQAAFIQFLLSKNNGTYFFALSSGGIIEVKRNLPGARYMHLDSLGTSQSLDMTRPEVQAALHSCACYFIVTSASSLLELFFRKSCRTISFAHFVLRNAKTTVIREEATQFSNMEPLHTVAVLTTLEGRRFVLDPSAAQYGWEETFAPMREYFRSRVDIDMERESKKAPDGAWTPTELTPMPETPGPELRDWVGRCITDDIVSIVEAHSMADDGFESVLGLPPSQFDEHCLILEQTLRGEMGVRDEQRAMEIPSDDQHSDSVDDSGSTSTQSS